MRMSGWIFNKLFFLERGDHLQKDVAFEGDADGARETKGVGTEVEGSGVGACVGQKNVVHENGMLTAHVLNPQKKPMLTPTRTHLATAFNLR